MFYLSVVSADILPSGGPSSSEDYCEETIIIIVIISPNIPVTKQKHFRFKAGKGPNNKGNHADTRVAVTVLLLNNRAARWYLV